MRRLVLHNYFPGARDDAGFKESDHPRAKSGPKAGQFVKGSGGGGSATTSTGHKLNPYFAKKFPEPKTNVEWGKQLGMALTMKNAHPNFREVCKMLIATGSKYGMTPQSHEQLKDKIAQSIALQAKNLKEVGEPAKAKKLEDKLKSWGKEALGSLPPLKKPAEPPAPPAPSKFPTPTSEELQKAKSSNAVPTFGLPPKAVEAVNAFNQQYQGLSLTDPEALAEKVQKFKHLQNKINAEKGIYEYEKQQAKAKQEAEASAKAKSIMKSLDISEEQYEGFKGLAKIVGGYGVEMDKLVEKFQHFESEAKEYGYPISGFECALIKSYSNGTYGGVNSALRSGTWDEATHVYAKMLNSALKKMPAHTGVVKRGADLSPKQQGMYKEGHIVEERSFTSTSTGKGFHGNTRFSITAKGKRGHDIKKLSEHSGEKEVLFQARTFFKVTKVEGTPGSSFMHVHMEEWDE